MKTWMDMKRRRGALPEVLLLLSLLNARGEPLIVLHVALTNEISSSIQVPVLPRFRAGR